MMNVTRNEWLTYTTQYAKCCTVCYAEGFVCINSFPQFQDLQAEDTLYNSHFTEEAIKT